MPEQDVVIVGGGPVGLSLALGLAQHGIRSVLSDVDYYTDLLTHYAFTAPDWVRVLAGAVVPTLLAQPWLMRIVGRRVGMLNTRYVSSTLLAGTDSSLGTRLDARMLRGQERVRLLDLVGPRAVLLLLDSGGLPRWDVSYVTRCLDDVQDLDVFRVVPARVPPGDGDLVDLTDRLWPLGRGSRCALLRPDGHVGWIGDGPTIEELQVGVRRALGAT